MARISVEPIIANTTMEKYIDSNNVERAYFIAPIEGYVLHHSGKDFTIIDEITMEETIVEGFASGSVSVPIDYDFDANPDNLYTKLASEVPADQIFGGNNGNVEVAKAEETEEVM